MALVFIRKLLDYVFTQKELSYLDSILPPFTCSAKKNKNEEGWDTKPKKEELSETKVFIIFQFKYIYIL